MGAKKDEYGNLIEPERPGEIDNSAVIKANQGVTAAKGALDNMSYDNFKQGSVYGGLKRDYEQQGQQAMKDTIGQVAARTGGMASSYATSAANQSYNNYMRQLEDVARSMYNDEYSKARDKVDLAQREYDTAYGEYRDSYNDAWDRYNADMQAYRYGIEDKRYDTEQSQKLQEKEENRIYSDAYYGNASSYADYKAAGGTLDEQTYNSIVAAAQGKYVEEHRTDKDTEYESIFGAQDFLWGDWDGDGNVENEGEDNTFEDLYGGSSYDEAYWNAFWDNAQAGYAEEDRAAAETAAVADIEARIANGESLDTIATDYKIGNGGDQKTWEDVTGRSEAEWKKIYNDNTIKNYSYKDTNAGRNEIVDTMINSRNLSLTAKDQNNFDYLFGNGAYKAVQNFIRAVVPINGADDREIERPWDEYQREEDILVSTTSLTVDQIENILKAANPYLFESLFPKER